LARHGGVDEAAFGKLCGLLRYVDGDSNDLAIPLAMFAIVVEQLARSDCNRGARDRREAVRARSRLGRGARSAPAPV
jgi:hypothetical protein